MTDTGLHRHDVLIIGGGNAGLSTAGRLRRYGVSDVAVIEPRSTHFYQPMFSHVAGGTAPASKATRPQGSVTPKDVTWIQDRVESIDPDAHTVTLASGRRLSYGQLVVCPGIQKDWAAVPGLVEAMESPVGVSNYEYEYAQKASRVLRDVRSGTVVFTQPGGPGTCSGAAQKPMYLACDFWRQTGVLADIRVVLVVPTPTLFGMPLIDAELERKVAEYGIEVRYGRELVEVDAARQTLVIAGSDRGTALTGPDRATRSVDGPRETLSYDVLHAVPPQSAPHWLADTGLTAEGDDGGFVEVDPLTLRHPRYSDVWALGDAVATVNSKSGGALRQQTTTLARNLVAALKGKPLPRVYNGYSVCPFVVSRSTVVFAEFDDRYRPKPTIPLWTGLAKERRVTFLADRYVLPWVYWNLILQGRA
ncbi:NAD(P)/FAD-dependent oxidoreductase [Rathayibacter iranicus]|uniref:Pyridine nucleotide-disulfide oxidoreductase n=2 Tax=Rathayibacter iranicus TaxID=59737 RepID=A0AAD1AFV6_9MICO|nr:FAD-dependent oxidoreductase [Rathayibacter iranicus]AZZ56425.1 pyridine nucleotide-disulfide oxidoreductase [Rathayibacter iranicus]MWV31800.1 pyridine nucleotide-disulfide oxidoreductase [Rathayibacter iranicus NCPPB 2253 = VKM Ac-1602]PPI44873.1 pyridine nucleotide-disulfide oxidoreductase [Rathayibacter iranicus]PPI59107.1 pyridine nucleotide-disulfide oxidoreductase [Rathayibacter iranicus]PPI70324.1 pyridine nucleotide-disulfide oxidoreductase [Rathayibacter iranicus]